MLNKAKTCQTYGHRRLSYLYEPRNHQELVDTDQPQSVYRLGFGRKTVKKGLPGHPVKTYGPEHISRELHVVYKAQLREVD
jgi:hypothetical protein